MRKKKMMVLLTTMTLLLAACGQSGSYDNAASMSDMKGESADAGFAYDDYEESYSEDAAEMETTTASTGERKEISEDAGKSEYSQKLIRNYSFSFQTTDFEKSLKYIEDQVSKYKGYIQESNTYGSSKKSSSMTIRIPSKNADAFLAETGQIGEIIQKSESTEDITLKYYDTKSRLESLNTQHDRILELLGKAESLEDVVTLEQHLSDIEYQIDSYGSQIKVYDNLVDYVTVSIELREVSQIQVVEEDTFWQKIVKGLSQNTVDVLEGISIFILFLVTGIPYFLILGIIIAIIVKVIKKIRKKRANKKQKQIQEQTQGQKE